MSEVYRSNSVKRRDFLTYSALSTLALATPGWAAQKRPIRIVVAGIAQEANTFRGDFTKLSDCGILRGEEIIHNNTGVRTDVGGMIDAARLLGVELVPAMVVWGGPGPFETSVYESLVKEVVARTVAIPNISGIALPLHGSGVVGGPDGIGNLEADFCHRLRAAVGPDVPMVATFDLHGNIPPETVQDLNGAFVYHDNPHIDTFERGQDAVKLLHRILMEDLKPQIYVERLPMLLAPPSTLTGTAREMKELCLKVEKERGIIACSFVHGFPYIDRPKAGCSVMVVAKEDRTLARDTAQRVAAKAWAVRDQLGPQLFEPRAAIARALKDARWPTALLDNSDNPGGSAPGDSTYLLRAMIEADLKDACFNAINDKEVAAQAHAAGRGARIHVMLGGKSIPINGKPISAGATVLSLSDGKFQITNPEGAGTLSNLGPCAAIKIGDIQVLVTSRPYQPYDPGLMKLHGIDVTKCKIVGLKSGSKWRAGFEGLIAQDMFVDTPGVMSMNVHRFDYHHVIRPVWPLDQGVSYPPAYGTISR